MVSPGSPNIGIAAKISTATSPSLGSIDIIR
jgi:hypothetical protein